MFNHRFDATNDSTSNATDSMHVMCDRAYRSLLILTSYLEGSCDKVSDDHVASVAYAVMLEISDIKDVLKIEANERADMRKQITVLSALMLEQPHMNRRNLDLLLALATVPESEHPPIQALIDELKIKYLV
jgi:hypothetical protein